MMTGLIKDSGLVVVLAVMDILLEDQLNYRAFISVSFF